MEIRMNDIQVFDEEPINNVDGRPINIGDLQHFDLEKRIQENWDRLENMGRITPEGTIRQGDFTGIKNAWAGRAAYVVGGSITGRGFDLTSLNGKYSIGCNHMIEYWHGFTWFVFQDHRFVRLCKYDLKKFQGKIFAHNTAPVEKKDYKDMVYFKSHHEGRPLSLDIQYGLYSRSLTGLCCVHLALISGADPIYLIGMDSPTDWNEEQGQHYAIDYLGENNSKDNFDGTIRAMKMFQKFMPHKNRFVNTFKGGCLEKMGIRSIDLEELPI
jgi:hypothetical protein